MNKQEYRELFGKEMNIVSVIGQNGKSTIAHMIHHCYLALEIESAYQTTEEILQKIPNKSYEKKVKDVIMEIPLLDIKEKKACYIDFDSLIFTNSGKNAEINDNWTMKRPFIALPINKTAIVNIDDEQGVDFCNMTVANTITYGFSELADIRGCNIKLSVNKTRFDLYYKGGFICRIEVPYFGYYNLHNMLATISYFVSQGYEPARIAQLLPELPSLAGRFDTFSTDSQIRIVIDYAKNPDAIAAILTSLKTVCEGNIITIIGAAGKTSRKTRELIGEIALSHSKQVIMTSDNPGNEEPQGIIYDMTKGSTRQNYRLCIDREKAIELALKMAKPKDVVVILGKGHEKKQLINEKEYPFCDKKTAEYLIEKFEI